MKCCYSDCLLVVASKRVFVSFLNWANEVAAVVQSGEEAAQGRPHCYLQLPEGKLWGAGGRPLLTGNQ